MVKEAILDPKNIVISESAMEAYFEDCKVFCKKFSDYLSKRHSKKPVVIKIKDNYVAIDGNKMITAARILRISEIEVYILEDTEESFSSFFQNIKKDEKKLYNSILLNYDKFKYFKENDYGVDIFQNDCIVEKCINLIKKCDCITNISVSKEDLKYGL